MDQQCQRRKFRQTPEVTTAFRLSWKQLNSTRAQGMQQNLKPGNLWQFRFTNKVFKRNSGGGQGHTSIVSACKIFPVFLFLIFFSVSFFLSLSFSLFLVAFGGNLEPSRSSKWTKPQIDSILVEISRHPVVTCWNHKVFSGETFDSLELSCVFT